MTMKPLKQSYLFNIKQLKEAFKDSFLVLSPAKQFRNPAMFVTYIGALLSTYFFFRDLFWSHFSSLNLQITIWLWFTMLFANFAYSIAESRGKAQAESLRKTQIDTTAHLLLEQGEETIPATELKSGDIIICRAGETIPTDGEVIEGVASVDESAITGESAPVIRESGGDRSAVTIGTKIVSDELKIKVTSEPGQTFLDRIIKLIEGAQRQKTPNEIALSSILSALTLIFLITVVTTKLFSDYTLRDASLESTDLVTVPILIALLVCLIPTTISALLSAIAIAGMNRLVQKNVIAKSGRAIEAAGDVDLLILDKTGTITLGNRMADKFIPAPQIDEKALAEVAQLASLSDETPEGRSIVILAKKLFDLRANSLNVPNARFIPFSAEARMSGVDIASEGGPMRTIRKGSLEAISHHIVHLGGSIPTEIESTVQKIAKQGGTPLVVSEGEKILGVIYLKDIIKGGLRERFAEMRRMGIRTLMVTGDNPLTAAVIAAEAGVDDFIAEATPEMKLARIRAEQHGGRRVAMTGDGTNDAPALAQADVGVTMNTGTQASREAGNMVDLDNNPTKLIEIIEVGKQLLMTRGALTTFSIANDIAKYFAIFPAIFAGLYAQEAGGEGPLTALNIMRLHSPQSAVLSAVIFNALVIIALVPLALKGVRYTPHPAEKILLNNVLIYGLGGVVAPFLGIKIIDMMLNYLHFV